MEPAQPMARAEEVAVVVVPFLAQGHLNQLLQLSLLLSARGLSVHFASSATHNRQAKTRIHGCDANSLSRIQFHDLPLPHLNFSTPPIPSDPHGHGHSHSPNNNFPSHLQPAFEATEHLRAPLAALLRSLSAASRRLVLIQDPLMSFAACDAASLPNAEIYNFQCVPAIFWLSSFWEHRGDHVAEPTPEALDVILASFEVTVPQEFIDVLDRRLDKTWEKASNLINTCRPIEGEFIDLLADLPALRGNKTFAIGPLNPVTLKRVDGNPRHGCLQWLDRQPPGSVVYVSFGTTSTMSEDQVQQLAIGLQRSGQRFIWVLRDADKGDIFADGEGDDKEQGRLPPGFETEVGGVGIVIRDWAPQLEILAHRATGVFMSHCGWNSCLESLSMGVPILAWPMHSDQPRNAMMVTEYLKVGVLVMEWARRERTVSAAEVEEAIKRVMVGSPEGEDMRRRAKELGEAVREAAADGGSSRAELDSFVAHITR